MKGDTRRSDHASNNANDCLIGVKYGRQEWIPSVVQELPAQTKIRSIIVLIQARAFFPTKPNSPIFSKDGSSSTRKGVKDVKNAKMQ